MDGSGSLGSEGWRLEKLAVQKLVEAFAPKTVMCETPGEGTSGKNKYLISDGTFRYCAEEQTCFSESLQRLGDWTKYCAEPDKIPNPLPEPYNPHSGADIGLLLFSSESHWVKRLQGVQYALGKTGEDECPPGFEPIKTTSTCEKAANSMSYGYSSSGDSSCSQESVCNYCRWCSQKTFRVDTCHHRWARWGGVKKDMQLDKLSESAHKFFAQTLTPDKYKKEGCFKDAHARDLPTLVGRGVTTEECAARCEGYSYFGLQYRRECWCGNSFGKHGKATGCNCDGDMIGSLMNCVHAYTEAIDTRSVEMSAVNWPRGSTFTANALGEVETELAYGRDDANSVVIVITDGKPYSERSTKEAAERLKQKARLIWVPIGPGAPVELIEEMASMPKEDHMVRIEQFSDLENLELLNKIVVDTCPIVG